MPEAYCVMLIPKHYTLSLVSTQGAYKNDHQLSLTQMGILKVKVMSSHETKGCVYNDDFENT